MAYHAYAPAVPYRYASDPVTPCLPSPIIALPHPAAYHGHVTAAPYRYASDPATPPCASIPMPHPHHSLQSFHSCSAL
ncbi:hypothetical protein O181_011222 [Austropuccinia psidii MF-1]|uniref:Uncharacterized protein n=1 Tax=Austropuccinia psidii MF-1 TaxID=1389203 RepID=A0A9Q3GLX5_9BASI|nr:hypothetical protein [Austropuccinia psidii MF-1]